MRVSNRLFVGVLFALLATNVFSVGESAALKKETDLSSSTATVSALDKSKLQDSGLQASAKKSELRKIVIDISSQTIQCFVGDKLVMSSKVSTAKSGISVSPGKKTPIKKVWDKKNKRWKYVSQTHNHLGEFSVKMKILKGWSRQFNCPMPYCLVVYQGHCIHECPKGTKKQIGSPASHGCIRLYPDFAKKLFAWAKVGDKVVIQK